MSVRRHGHAGKARSITYRTWDGIVQRTTNPGHKSFPSYAGKVDPSFLGPGGFDRFVAVVGLRPGKDHTLDRIDGSQGYVPGNLRWADKSAQERNKPRAAYYGRTVYGWSVVLGVKPGTVRKRLARGMHPDQMFPVELRL
jgi:hypothetical protein